MPNERLIGPLIWYLSLFTLMLVSCSQGGEGPTPTSGLVGGLPSISELAGTPAPEIPPLPALDADIVANGEVVYGQYCAECHGAALEGEAEWQVQEADGTFRAPPHDASGHTWHHGDRVLLEAIRLGGTRLTPDIGGFSDMPAFEQILSDEEIEAVLTYIKSTWPEDIRAIQWERTVSERAQG